MQLKVERNVVWVIGNGIRAKITRLCLINCSLVLLLAGGALLVDETVKFTRDLEQQRRDLAEVTASNIAAAVLFQDEITAQENLDSLGQLPDVESASIRMPDGAVLAQFSRLSETTDQTNIPQQTLDNLNDRVAVTSPVMVDQETVGYLQIVSTKDRLDEKRLRYLLVFTMVALVGLATPARRSKSP